MNNTVKMTFWISKGKMTTVGPIQVRWANVQAIDVKFSHDFTHQKIIKIG